MKNSRSRANTQSLVPPVHTILSTTVLPASSLKDIVALIFILVSLPQFVSCIVLAVYIGSGSSKWYSTNPYRVRQTVKKAVQALAINSLVLMCCFWLLPLSCLEYVAIFAKSIMASELMGSPSSSTSITSITTTTVSGVSTKTTSINSVPVAQTTSNHKRINSKVNYVHKYMLTHLVNSTGCFGIVLYAKYLIGLLVQKEPKVYLLVEEHLVQARLQLLTKTGVKVAFSTPIAAVFSKSFFFVYLLLCIHIVVTTILPVLSVFHDSSLSELPSVPVEYKKFHESAKSDKNEPEVPPIVEIDIENIEEPHLSLALDSVISSNFMTFLTTPLTSRISNLLQVRPKTVIDSKRPSTFVDRSLVSVISVQPFWSLLALTKIILKSSVLFAGGTTDIIDSKVSLVSIGDTKVVLRSSQMAAKNEIFLNGVKWPYFKTHPEQNTMLIGIFGLTPLFLYEIEVRSENGLVGALAVNTVCEKSVLNTTPEVTPLLTIQSSLVSTIKSLEDTRAKFKRLKRDENRKISDMKKEILGLKTKIEKFTGSQHETPAGKVKGIQDSVASLEQEIETMEKSLHDSETESTQEKFREQEKEFSSKIEQLQDDIQQHENESLDRKKQVKHLQHDLHQLSVKNKRILDKQQARSQEVTRMEIELNRLKRSMLSKIDTRKAMVKMRYDTVLPAVVDGQNDMRQLAEEYGQYIYNTA